MTENTPPSVDASPSSFASLGLDSRLVDALAVLGYEEPTSVQAEAIPLLLQGRDLLGLAATGTGKTAAFALPLLHQLASRVRADGERPSALVLVPTRELAMQVAEAIYRYGKGMGVSALAVYGGTPFDVQLRALRRGVPVVVATPGRALDHIRRGSLDLGGLSTVVLDEADEMMDMGFAEDLESILQATPPERQTALFSATLPPRVAALTSRYLRDPVRVMVAREVAVDGEAPRVRQVAYIVPRAHKMAALGRILDVEQPSSVMVFCRTRNEVDSLAETLSARGNRTAALHGGLSQEQRDRVMKGFRSGGTDILVATDVAARGLDIAHVSHVVNFDVPAAAESYVHRIGRTGRAGREGVAITLAEPREHRLLRGIEAQTRQRIQIATVPTVADLRARRLEGVRASMRETLLAGELDSLRVVVESLAAEFDVMDIAAAAVRLMLEREGGEADQEEIPQGPPMRDEGGRAGAARTSRGPRAAGADGTRGAPTARVFVGAGRKQKIRPGDLVGAIVNEAGVAASAIGSIQITDSFSMVELPETLVDRVIEALRTSSIKGRKVPVRRERP
jgi:ATP-dependent RNA helicase DeaD